MPDLAENIFSFTSHRLQPDRPPRRSVETPTDVSSFQTPVARPIAKSAQNEEEAELIFFDFVIGKVVRSDIIFPSAHSSILTRGVGDVGRATSDVGTMAPGQFYPLQAPSFLADVSPLIQAQAVKTKKTALEIVDEAKRRLEGRESLVDQVHLIVEEEAAILKIGIKRIVVRPGWSHEYQDKTSVVMYVEIQGETESRFSLWDAICERLQRLENSLPDHARQFLSENIFVAVSKD